MGKIILTSNGIDSWETIKKINDKEKKYGLY